MKILKWLAKVTVVAGALIILGTVGAADNMALDMERIVAQMQVGITVFGLGGAVLALKGRKGGRR